MRVGHAHGQPDPTSVFPFLDRGPGTTEDLSAELGLTEDLDEDLVIETEGIDDQAIDIVAAWLPDSPALTIGAVHYVRDPQALIAVWRAHRAMFAGRGRLDLAVVAAQLLAALREHGERLRAVEVTTTEGAWTLWLDERERRLVGAHPAFDGALPPIAVGPLT